jgi:hypothetical protein
LTTGSAREIYRKEYVEKVFERMGLFTLIADRFAAQSALYPGSYTHLTPAFAFPNTCFVDTDRRAARFFADPAVLDYVKRRRIYAAEPIIRYHQMDYTRNLPEEPQSFDLLISQYAGFVSQACKRFLRIGGYLVANNSHGDAGIAAIDSDYQLVAAILRRGERHRLVEKDLDGYFVPKRDVEITHDYLLETRKGIGYTKSAFSYVFTRSA